MAAGSFSVLGLLAVFLFQRFNLAAYVWDGLSNIQQFMINRTVRFLLNDVLAILLIYALFREKKYVVFSVYVQLFGLIFFLIPYFLLKLQWPSYNGPLVSFLHRLILNPTLLMLLIPAFFYQRHLNRLKNQ